MVIPHVSQDHQVIQCSIQGCLNSVVKLARLITMQILALDSPCSIDHAIHQAAHQVLYSPCYSVGASWALIHLVTVTVQFTMPIMTLELPDE